MGSECLCFGTTANFYNQKQEQSVTASEWVSHWSPALETGEEETTIGPITVEDAFSGLEVHAEPILLRCGGVMPLWAAARLRRQCSPVLYYIFGTGPAAPPAGRRRQTQASLQIGQWSDWDRHGSGGRGTRGIRL